MIAVGDLGSAEPLVRQLDDKAALALAVPNALDPRLALAWAEGVRAAREAWIESFNGDQHSLGRAWYTDLELDRTDDYFAEAERSNALVEAACPGLQEAMRVLVAKACGGAVVQRPGWCGSGVHIFPAGGHVAKVGGEIHYDSEGLTPAHCAARAPALTIVLMLDPPVSGGGLKVWDVRYRGTDEVTDEDLAQRSVVCEYGVADLVLIDSYRLHQIQPFGGDKDRISATCHAAFVAGEWETWF